LSVKERMANALSGLNDAPHGFIPSLTAFQDIEMDKAKRDLQLEKRAIETAANNEPALGSSAFDSVENDIVDVVESVKSNDIQVLSDQFEVYSERLAALNFEGRLGDIEIGIKEAIAEFQRIISTGEDELHARRRSLLFREKDLEVFRIENNLRRAAYYPTLPKKIFLSGLIAVFVLIETITNTSFLAKGNELGILGAYSESLAISCLNLFGAMVFALCVKNAVHVHIFRKLAGATTAIGYVIFLISLNLLVAHYREVSGVLLENGGMEAILRLKSSPFGLAEFQSWILLGMGCLFSIASFWDAWQLNDTYPGYGKKTQIVEEDREEYLNEKQHHIDELAEHLSEAIDLLRSTKHDLMKWRQEHSSILESRNRLIHSFDEQMARLERSGNTLLTAYREFNKKARGGKAPKRFKETWKMLHPNIDREVPAAALDRDKTALLIEQTAKKLDTGVATLHEQHDIGLIAFRKLDDLVEDEKLNEVSIGSSK
jgi:hypothetical protein